MVNIEIIAKEFLITAHLIHRFPFCINASHFIALFCALIDWRWQNDSILLFCGLMLKYLISKIECCPLKSFYWTLSRALVVWFSTFQVLCCENRNFACLFFISLFKMSGSRCPSSSLFCCLYVREHDSTVERGNRCGALLGKRMCLSLFRQADNWIRRVSGCLCTAACFL